MARYRLVFRKKATKQWNKLGETLRRQFDKKLRERLNAPRIPGDALRGYRDCYRIKLRNAGYRLIYRVDDERVVLVLTIGQRERGEVYEDLAAIMADKHDRS